MNNLIGSVFDRLTVLRVEGQRAVCRCQCGGQTTTAVYNLRNGHTRSCGCLQRERTSEASKTHGMTGTWLYEEWSRMKRRCYNPHHDKYKYYGARRIKVCRRWQSFENFAKDVGERPSSAYTLDRIDSDKDYSPNNCRWSTKIEQMRNTRKNRYFTLNGETHCISEWAELYGLSQQLLGDRLRKGLSLELALSLPKQPGRKFRI